MSVERTLTVMKDHPALSGHFPGVPVVPGVLVLDEVIETMRATGRDMSSHYKETSTGGLAINVAVNFIEC